MGRHRLVKIATDHGEVAARMQRFRCVRVTFHHHRQRPLGWHDITGVDKVIESYLEDGDRCIAQVISLALGSPAHPPEIASIAANTIPATIHTQSTRVAIPFGISPLCARCSPLKRSAGQRAYRTSRLHVSGDPVHLLNSDLALA